MNMIDSNYNNNNSSSSNMVSKRRLKRGARRAVALLVASSMSVAGFSTLQPMTTPLTSYSNGHRDGIDRGQPLSASSRRSSTRQQRLLASSSSLQMNDINNNNNNDISHDQHEFELAVGHAMDVLRSDYPEILSHKPDFSIYDSNIEIIDPSGVRLHGVNNYQSAFRLMHGLVNIFYCQDRSGLTFRMCFDKARQNIRIHWNAQVIPKAIFGGYKTTLHVDGISVYEISKMSGNITQHRIERLVINDNAIAPEKGVFAAMTGIAKKSQVDGVPTFSLIDFDGFHGNHIHSGDEERSTTQQNLRNNNNNNNNNQHNPILRFQNFAPNSRSVLFSASNEDESKNEQDKSVRPTSMSSLQSSSSSFDGNNIDWDALEKKNLARKKFGLKPLTPEEFMDLQEKVQELDSQRQQQNAATLAEMAEKKRQEDNPGLFKKLFGGVLESTCDSNYDCERPEVCCDFGFKKMCCSSGMRILDGPPQSRQGQLAEIPVIANPGNDYPPNYGQGNRY